MALETVKNTDSLTPPAILLAVAEAQARARGDGVTIALRACWPGERAFLAVRHGGLHWFYTEVWRHGYVGGGRALTRAEAIELLHDEEENT